MVPDILFQRKISYFVTEIIGAFPEHKILTSDVFDIFPAIEGNQLERFCQIDFNPRKKFVQLFLDALDLTAKIFTRRTIAGHEHAVKPFVFFLIYNPRNRFHV